MQFWHEEIDCENDDNAVVGHTIWYLAYLPFKYPDIPPDIWCPHQSVNGLMQQGGQICQGYYQIIVVCKVTLTQGHWS